MGTNGKGKQKQTQSPYLLYCCIFFIYIFLFEFFNCWLNLAESEFPCMTVGDLRASVPMIFEQEFLNLLSYAIVPRVRDFIEHFSGMRYTQWLDENPMVLSSTCQLCRCHFKPYIATNVFNSIIFKLM